MIDNDGKKIIYHIRRLRCAPCNRIHHELPDCIVPYKRHCAETIEAITNGIFNKAPCEGRTIQRILTWWKILQPYLSNILKSLAIKYITEYQSLPAFKETIRAVVNSNNWIFINSICTRSVCVSR